MTKRYSPGMRDKNEKYITAYLRRANVRYTLLQAGAGADILIKVNPMMLVEVKNPDLPPSDRQLTETEAQEKAYCEECGIPYHIVESPEEMAVIINDLIERNSNGNKVQHLVSG